MFDVQCACLELHYAELSFVFVVVLSWCSSSPPSCRIVLYACVCGGRVWRRRWRSSSPPSCRVVLYVCVCAGRAWRRLRGAWLENTHRRAVLACSCGSPLASSLPTHSCSGFYDYSQAHTRYGRFKILCPLGRYCPTPDRTWHSEPAAHRDRPAGGTCVSQLHPVPPPPTSDRRACGAALCVPWIDSRCELH